jgi:S1-C subfamily serine protease
VVVFVATLGGLFVVPVEAEDEARAPGGSIVKVYVRSNPPDLLSPWQRLGLQSSTGSGVIVDGNRILTSAHVVDDAVSIEVKRSGMSRPFVAEIDHVGQQCDLALLRVEDESFFDGARPIALGDMPQTQTRVQAYGFPVGGESISVTSGIISRVEMSTYSHSLENLLLAQVDAALNPGNSGGPVLAASKIVGIAAQSLDEAENVGYMIPVPVIRHFLNDVDDGSVDGTPRLGAEFQNLESEALRRSLGMAEKHTGALVTWVDHGSAADGVLRPRDVLMEIDGFAIANDTTVPWPRVGRVHFSEVYRSKQVGESVSVRLLRDGKQIDRDIELTQHAMLVPGRRDEDEPQYLVFGGLVFQPLTVEYLMYFEEIPYDLATYAVMQNVVTAGRRQLILIQKVLPNAVNRGFQTWEDYIVRTVNGTTPRDMQHLASILDSARGQFLRIVTENRSFLTLDLEQARAAQSAILRDFGIPHDRSSGLRENVAPSR